MEYLMTYGWAILIIAVVLGALFSLGVFDGSIGLSNACVAASGYICSGPTYSHTTGIITVSLGQDTGIHWATANFIYVPNGAATSAGLPVTMSSFQAIALNGNVEYGAGGGSSGLASGQIAIALWLPVNGVSNAISMTPLSTPLAIGSTSITGEIWVEYTTMTSSVVASTPQYARIASINLKAS